MKLGTHVVRDTTHNYCKGPYSRLIMPLFRLRHLCKTCSHGHNSIAVQDILMKLGTHIARDNMYMYSKGLLSRIY